MKLISYSKYYDSILYPITHPILCFKNYRLTRKYPWLYPRSRWDDSKPKHYHYQWTELDCVPGGWRKCFGEMMMKDLLIACKTDDVDPKDLRIVDLKEKWGALRITLNMYTPNIDRVINAYEHVSEHICYRCGKLDVPMTNFGWVLPLCRDCSDDVEKYDKYISELENEDFTIPRYYTVHTFSENCDQYVSSDLTWITDRLRGVK